MKRLLYIVVLGLVATAAWTGRAAGALSHADAEKEFIEARIAYDEGRYADAIRLYEGLLSQGLTASRLHFNLGNAYVRSGRLGEAVLQYRRALHLRPRDPDAAANLRFTQDLTGAIAPAEPAWSRVLRHVSAREWGLAAVSAYWLGALALALHRLRPAWRWLRHAALVFGLVLLASGAGILREHGYARRPEVVIVQRDVQSLFAPVEGSQPHFKLAEGSIVRQIERRGAWLRVSTGETDGWIPEAVAQPVLPLR